MLLLDYLFFSRIRLLLCKLGVFLILMLDALTVRLWHRWAACCMTLSSAARGAASCLTRSAAACCWTACWRGFV
jgi:hypothetical protein